MDLFNKKIPLFPLEEFHPSYKGRKEPPREFVASLYLSKVRKESQSGSGGGGGGHQSTKRVFHHFTCATDTAQIKIIFQDVVEIIIAKSLRETHLM